MAVYKNINNIDTVYLTYIETPTVIYSQHARRATISGTTITYHTTDTTVSQGNISGALTVPRYSSGGIEFDSSNNVHIVNGALDPNQDITWTGNAVDPGTAEQATPPTWGVQTVIDNSQSNTVKSGVTFDVGSGNLLHIGDDGTSDTTLTGLISYSYPAGGSWSSNGSLTGTISAINKNDWNAIDRNTGDIHLVYRNSSGSLIHKRWNGSTWLTGQAIPAQNNLASGGIALTTDGASVWLAIIDTDSANTVRYIQWTSGDYTGHGDAWSVAWSVVEGSVATRTFLGAAPSTDGNFNALFYWTEGSNMVAASASAPFPPDPPGLANRDAISALGSGASSATLAIVFTGTQPPKGDKIIVGFWASYASTPTITSVKDNASVQNTFTAAGASSVGSAQGVWIYWLDMPGSATWTGNYTVTVTFSASVTESDGGAIAYSNMQNGGPTAVNNNTSTSATATPGSVTPPATPATYFAVVTDATASNPATFTWPAPYLKEITQTNGSTQQAGSLGDALNNNGAQNPSITINSSLWNAAQAAFPGAPQQFPVLPITPGRTWRRRFTRRPIPGLMPAAASATQAFADIGTRFILVVRSYADSKTRITINARSYADVATRFTTTARSYGDIKTRFVTTSRAYSDIRIRLVLTARAFADSKTRFVTIARSYGDLKTRLTVNAPGFGDMKTRFKILSSATYTDLITRFRLTARSVADPKTRITINARSYGDLVTRFLNTSRAIADLKTRLTIDAPFKSDIASRFIVSAPAGGAGPKMEPGSLGSILRSW